MVGGQNGTRSYSSSSHIAAEKAASALMENGQFLGNNINGLEFFAAIASALADVKAEKVNVNVCSSSTIPIVQGGCFSDDGTSHDDVDDDDVSSSDSFSEDDEEEERSSTPSIVDNGDLVNTPSSQDEQIPEHEFLDDIEPRLKRVFLATHSTYCENVKIAERKKQSHQQQTRKFLSQPPLAGQALAFHPPSSLEYRRQTVTISSPSSSSSKKRKLAISSGVDDESTPHQVNQQQQTEDDMVSLLILEPDIVRMSIYEKLVIKYQHFYNQQNIPGMMSIMKPYCTDYMLRQNKLWAKLTLPSYGGMTPPSSIITMIAEQSYCGIDNLAIVLENIYSKLPDCMLLYKQSIIKKLPSIGTVVFTPFTYFGTISLPIVPPMVIAESSSDSSSNIPPKVISSRLIEIELTGWNVLQFDLNDIITWRVDNYFVQRMIGSDANPSAQDMLWKFMFNK